MSTLGITSMDAARWNTRRAFGRTRCCARMGRGRRSRSMAASNADVRPEPRRRAAIYLFPVPHENYTLAAAVRLRYGNIDQSIASDSRRKLRCLVAEVLP